MQKDPAWGPFCFGLNDSTGGEDKLDLYYDSLVAIFNKLKDAGSEVIFMTPNMMATKLSPTLHESFVELIGKISERQTSGLVDKYINAARELCEKENVPLCDCYAKWKKLEQSGVDITELLANKVNHPVREMHELFATALLETMMR